MYFTEFILGQLVYRQLQLVHKQNLIGCRSDERCNTKFTHLHLTIIIYDDSMPPKRGPKILVDVFDQPQASNGKKKSAQRRTVTLEQHTSYDVTGEKTTSFMPVPISPAKRRVGEASGSIGDVIDAVLEPLYAQQAVPLTEDEIEQGIDESRLLELEGLGHLAPPDGTMRTSRIGPAPAQKRKRPETVSCTTA